jgi:cytochrome c5
MLLLAGLVLWGCGREQPPPPEVTTATDATAGREAIMAHWSRSCALCHVDGTGGAPRVGVAAEWQPRLTAGDEVLLAHTLEGFGNMPPLGYCMSCTEDDFRALIRFMTASGGPT